LRIVPLDEAGSCIELRMPGLMVFDVVAARETGDGRIAVHVTAHPDPWPSLAWLWGVPIEGHLPHWDARLFRLLVDLRTGQITSEVVNPKPVMSTSYAPGHRRPFAFQWSEAAAPDAAPDLLVRVDLERGACPVIPAEAVAFRGVVQASGLQHGGHTFVFADGESPSTGRLHIIDDAAATPSVVGVIHLPWAVPWRAHGVFQAEQA